MTTSLLKTVRQVHKIWLHRSNALRQSTRRPGCCAFDAPSGFPGPDLPGLLRAPGLHSRVFPALPARARCESPAVLCFRGLAYPSNESITGGWLIGDLHEAALLVDGGLK